MNPGTPHSHGHPLTVAAVVGSFALAVGLLMRASGVLRGAEEGIHARYLAAGFPIGESSAQPWWGLLVLGVVVFGLALLLLEVPGTGRRALLALTVLVLMGAASPVMALWGTYWSPLGTLVSGGWCAFCATLWARHHPMPCEVVEEPKDGKVISITKESDERRKQG